MGSPDSPLDLSPLDFSPLDGPLDAGEGRARRRALRGGRPAIAELSTLQWVALPFVAFGWLLLVPAIAIVVTASVEWVLEHGPATDEQPGIQLLIAGTGLALLTLIVLTRLALVPPRWGRWVRMQRFAEANGLVFVRRAAGDDLPAAVAGVAGAAPGAGLLSDAFLHPSGLVVGNAGEGLGRQAFVLVPEGLPENGQLAPEESPLRGFDLVSTVHGTLALRHAAVGRSSADIRRLFATADASRRGDQVAIR